jgi:diguanylate cyclase (GGDEF)-like protein
LKRGFRDGHHVRERFLPVPAFPDNLTPRPSLAGATEAIHAVSRLVSAGAESHDLERVGVLLLEETRALLGVADAVLIALADDEEGARVVSPGNAPVGAAGLPALAELEERGLSQLQLDRGRAEDLAGALGLSPATAGSALLLALPPASPTHAVALVDPDPAALSPEGRAAAAALAAAGAAAVARRRDAEEAARHADGHHALTRAAKNLHESLDLETVLHRICQEANRILDGDYTAVYRGTREGVVIEAGEGVPPEMIGFRLAPGQGLSGKVLDSEQSMLTNDYASIAGLPPDTYFSDVRSCLAVPMTWGGELRGVLTVGYKRPFRVDEEHLRLLETFAELATVACTNASAHAGLALAARTDGLTGCLNHAALHESLRREIERAERSAAPALSLIMLDLDDFKSVNDLHGHLVGDEVLRRAGHALRQATRPYDVTARYGGDEFALLAVEAGEEEAGEIAYRAAERITTAIADLCEGGAGRATAGLAEWSAGVAPTELVARADRALLFGKHEGARGQVVPFSTVPEWFRPGRFSRRTETGDPLVRPVVPRVSAPEWSGAVRPTEQRLRDRTFQLARVTSLGARMTAMVDTGAILGAAVDCLQGVFADATGAALRPAADGPPELVAGSPLRDSTVAVRCLQEGRSVLAAPASGRARLAVPLTVDDRVWGAFAVEAAAGALDGDDVRLAEALAEHTGAALQAALRYAALEREHAVALAALRDARGAAGT